MTGSSLSEWARPLIDPRLEQGWTQPDIVGELLGDVPIRLAPDGLRPALARLVADRARALGHLTVSGGVNEPGPSKQLPLLTREEVLTVMTKRIMQGGNLIGTARAIAVEWCEAHPSDTPEDLMSEAERRAA